MGSSLELGLRNHNYQEQETRNRPKPLDRPLRVYTVHVRRLRGLSGRR